MRLLCALLLTSVALGAAETPLTLISPVQDQVWQRQDKSSGLVEVSGVLASGEASPSVEIRLDGGEWRKLSVTATTGADGQRRFTGQTQTTTGLHTLEARITEGTLPTRLSAPRRFGVGEVFLVTGQSNSANHGEGRQQAASGHVFTVSPKGEWRACADPQPGASGNGGSFLPALGDELHRRLGVPVGFIACGIGATSVREWLPAGIAFPNPPSIVSRVRQSVDGNWEADGKAYAMLVTRMKSVPAFRAVLWHQGESDAKQKDPTRTLPGETYAKLLTQLIARSRLDSGRDVPWFVAQVSYHSPADPGSDDLRAAQAGLWRSGVALAGPDTDALGGLNRDQGGKGIHFSSQGLKAHALAWADKVAPWVESRP